MNNKKMLSYSCTRKVKEVKEHRIIPGWIFQGQLSHTPNLVLVLVVRHLGPCVAKERKAGHSTCFVFPLQLHYKECEALLVVIDKCGKDNNHQEKVL